MPPGRIRKITGFLTIMIMKMIIVIMITIINIIIITRLLLIIIRIISIMMIIMIMIMMMNTLASTWGRDKLGFTEGPQIPTFAIVCFTCARVATFCHSLQHGVIVCKVLLNFP